MTELTKEEKIAKLDTLINEGKSLFVTQSYEQPDFSYDGSGPTTQYYSDVNHDSYPGWRMKSLALINNLLGESNIYAKEFEENCKATSTEHNLRQGLGVLEAVKSGYIDDTINDSKQNVADRSSYPDTYWHCAIKLLNQKDYSVVNDLTFGDLQKKIIKPWATSRPFTVDGKIVNNRESLEEIKIAQTHEPMEYYKNIHNAKMREAKIIDGATDRSMLPLEEGIDYTQELLFENKEKQDLQLVDPSFAIVERVCQRIGKTANLLKTRSRKGKKPYLVDDEYDVQDLLHATLRAFIKHSVQENPLPKLAGSSSRADITIEELGLVIEVKYVRSPHDQKQLTEAFAQDILLYSQWEHLKAFIYLVFNSADLRDPEDLESLGGSKEINGRKFTSKVILG